MQTLNGVINPYLPLGWSRCRKGKGNELHFLIDDNRKLHVSNGSSIQRSLAPPRECHLIMNEVLTQSREAYWWGENDLIAENLGSKPQAGMARVDSINIAWKGKMRHYTEKLYIPRKLIKHPRTGKPSSTFPFVTQNGNLFPETPTMKSQGSSLAHTPNMISQGLPLAHYHDFPKDHPLPLLLFSFKVSINSPSLVAGH